MKETLRTHSSWFVILLFAVLLLNGCGLSPFIPPEEEAVVDEHVFDILGMFDKTGVHALSTKVERRLVLMDRRENNKKKEKYTLTVCAEPSPEAAQALNSFSRFSGTLKDKATMTQETALKIARDLSTAVSVSFKRTQGLQFYRDGAYQLCQAYMNGFITYGGKPCTKCFLKKLSKLQEDAKELIETEIEKENFYRSGLLPTPPSHSNRLRLITGVPEIIDADTMQISGERVELEGIDALEANQECEKDDKKEPCGQQALDALTKYIKGQPVSCVSEGRIKNRQVLVTCFLKNQDVNAWLVLQGHAFAYPKHSTRYQREEDEAKQGKSGAWALEFEYPWIWRNMQRTK